MKTYAVEVTTCDNIYHTEVTASNPRACIGRALEAAFAMMGKKKYHWPAEVEISATLLNGKAETASNDEPVQ